LSYTLSYTIVALFLKSIQDRIGLRFY